jgi:hypothetical protein
MASSNGCKDCKRVEAYHTMIFLRISIGFGGRELKLAISTDLSLSLPALNTGSSQSYGPIRRRNRRGGKHLRCDWYGGSS